MTKKFRLISKNKDEVNKKIIQEQNIKLGANAVLVIRKIMVFPDVGKNPTCKYYFVYFSKFWMLFRALY